MDKVIQQVNGIRRRMEFVDKYVYTREILFEKYKSPEARNSELIRKLNDSQCKIEIFRHLRDDRL